MVEIDTPPSFSCACRADRRWRLAAVFIGSLAFIACNNDAARGPADTAGDDDSLNPGDEDSDVTTEELPSDDDQAKPAKPAVMNDGAISRGNLDSGTSMGTMRDASQGATEVDGGGSARTDAAIDTTAERPAATSFSFPVAERELITVEPRFNLFRPRDITQPGFKLPVVVWANGGCLRSDFIWHDALFKRWAAAGFVVLSLTGGSGVLGNASDLLGMTGQTNAGHQKQLIDWVVAQNASGPYAGKLDLDRIIAAGNSCGGVTSLKLASEDERVAGIFVLSGSSAVGSTDRQVMSKIKVPLGFVVGSLEQDIAAPNAVSDYEALAQGVPGMVVHRFEGDHVTVSTGEAILPEVGEIALNWMDLVLYGTQGAYDALSSKNVCNKCTSGWWTSKAKNLETLKK